MNAYYKVTAGPTYDIIHKHMTAHMEANNAALEWSKKHDLPVQGISGTCVYFKSGFTPDAGTFKKGKRGGFVPRAKTEAGKQLLDELKALPQYPSWFSLISDFVGNREKMDFMKINSTGTPGISKNKSQDFYWLNINTYWLPEDRTGLEEVKASEYNATKSQPPTDTPAH